MLQSSTATMKKDESFSANKQSILTWIRSTLRESAWAPLGVLAFYAAGLTFDWFERFPMLDMPTHFLGGVAITYFFRSAIRHSQVMVGDIPLPIQVLFAITSTGTTAVLWEFYENFLDRFFGFHMVRGLEDTITDLFMGLAGALILSIFYRRG